jgi:uncharacterized GH25 family protein
MKRSAFCFLLVAALATATTANGSPRVGGVAGTVLNAQGKPVAKASVTIETSDGQHPHATYTDAHGHFAFVRFESGQYDLRAFSNAASSDWLKRVLIRSGKTTQITLRLTK